MKSFKHISTKNVVYATHMLLYGSVHSNPRKCIGRVCPRCGKVHPCPATN